MNYPMVFHVVARILPILHFLGKEEKQRMGNKSTNDCFLWQMDGLQRKIIVLLRIYSGHQYLKRIVRSQYHFLNGESFLSNGFFSTFS